MTLCGATGSNSAEFAPGRPHTFRAYSITAHCNPRQIPKNGSPCSRAQRTAEILPSIPRSPKPPGTRSPSTRPSGPAAPSPSICSASTHASSTRASLAIPPWTSASVRLLYESLRSIYLPTTAIRVWCCGDFTFRTMSSQRERSTERAPRPSSFRMIASSPSRWNTSGTS